MMRYALVVFGFSVAALLSACGTAMSNDSDGSDAAIDAHADAEPSLDAPAANDVLDANAGTDARDAPGAETLRDAATAVTADQLLALTTACTRIPGSPLYATDEGLTPTIPLCQLTGAIFWQADMDIDCDGGSSALCRSDPSYQADTSAHTSTDLPLDASTVPFVVIPLPRTGFDYSTHGIQLGSVVAVIYRGQLTYGVFGDEGPDTIIGEASYALATSLGVDGNPVTGGVDSGVTYIVFTGATGAVTRNEDSAEAMRVGAARAAQLVSGM